MSACSNCGDDASVGGRCDSCYRYFRRTGGERTKDMIADSGERALHRQGDSGYLGLLVRWRLRQNVELHG